MEDPELEVGWLAVPMKSQWHGWNWPWHGWGLCVTFEHPDVEFFRDFKFWTLHHQWPCCWREDEISFVECWDVVGSPGGRNQRKEQEQAPGQGRLQICFTIWRCNSFLQAYLGYKMVRWFVFCNARSNESSALKSLYENPIAFRGESRSRPRASLYVAEIRNAVALGAKRRLLTEYSPAI